MLSSGESDDPGIATVHLWRTDTMEVACELRTAGFGSGAFFSANGTHALDVVCFVGGEGCERFTVSVWDISSEYAAYSPLALPTSPPSLCSDLLALLRSGVGCDVTLVASCGARFPAHRFILSLRSEKLRAQLAGAFADSAAAQLPVPAEFSARAVQQLLEFMYADTLELEDVEEATEQLAAADYFRVARLQSLAEAALARGLTSQNAAAILALADRHNAFGLRDVTLSYIARAATMVMRSDGWATLLAEAPRLAADVLFTSASGRPPTRGETADARAAAVRATAAGTAARADDVPALAADGAGAAPGDASRTRKRLR